MSRKRIFIIGALLAVVVLGGVGAVGFWQYHEQPQFCATCHLMDPYLESWQTPGFGAQVHAEEGLACLDCHEPTVQQQMNELVVYLQGDFRDPLKERKFGNEFCFDCHVDNEHTSYEEVTARTEDYTIDDELVNPHSPPHEAGEGTGEQPDCRVCHKMHQESPGTNYCFGCHHTGTFRACTQCHEE
jgi:cytochrome c nitrite reductase small subunit